MTEHRSSSSWTGSPSTYTRALVVMPTYNERPNIERIVPEILVTPRVDILVVDDASPDGTAGAVRELAREYPGRVHLIERPSKLGLGTAYVAGFKWGLARDYSHILEMDADFSHHPAALPRLLHASRDAELVIGSRYVTGGRTVDWSPLRKLISRSGSLYARTILGLNVRDLTGGFKCFRRHVLEAIDLDAVTATGYAFQVELTYRAAQMRYRIVEIPITFADRRVGTSKMSGGIVAEALVRVLALRLSTSLPERRPSIPVPLTPLPVLARRRRADE